MATKSVTNTFMKGMNKDLDKSVRPKESYLHAENFRVTASDSSTSGALENVKGNTLLTNAVSGMIIGAVEARDFLIVFTTSNLRPAGTVTSKIYAFPIIDGEVQPSHSLTGTASFQLYTDLGKSTFLNFSLQNPIKAVARYETDDVIKVYWTDGYNNVRWVNISDPDIDLQEAERFDLIPDAALPKASINSLISGSLKAGKIQYTYQLYKSKGSETLFAPMSDLIHLVADNDNLGTSQHYEGTDFNENTGKGVRISISNTNTGYDFIRGIALHYNALNTTPTIRVFDEQAIDSTVASTISLNDTGGTLGTFEFEEFSVVSRSLFKCEDLETKDDYLFAANITEDFFDIGDWDARAYRFEAANTSFIYHNYTDSANYTYLEVTAGAAIDGYTWTEYLVTTGDPFPGSVTGEAYATEDIPETYDCVNRFNDYSYDGTANHQHIFQTDGTTIGAEGLNINIVVESAVDAAVIQEVVIDHDHTRFVHGAGSPPTAAYQQTESESDNTSYTGYASPYIASQYMGYMRNEVYRFGIVFYDDKGRKSFVRWSCDLKMPVIEEEEITDVDGNNNIVGRILTPRFDIHATEASGLPTNAVAYQIVRVKREGTDDRNILAQGVVSANRVDTAEEYPVSIDDSTTTNVAGTEYVYFNSPEVSFNRNLTYSSGDQLVVHAYASDGAGTGLKINTNHARFSVNKMVHWNGLSIETGYANDIDSAIIISPGDNTYNLGGTNTVHMWEDTDPTALIPSFFKGTSLLVLRNKEYGAAITGEADSPTAPGVSTTVSTSSTTGLINGDLITIEGTAGYDGLYVIAVLIADTSFDIVGKVFGANEGAVGTWSSSDWPLATPSNPNYRYLCNYTRNNWLSQYGGNTYESRSRNVYMAVGNVETATGEDNVYNGDTYIVNFDMFHLISDLSQDGTTPEHYQCSGLIFPVETTINCDLRHDTSSLNKQLPFVNASELLKVRMTQEIGGLWEDGDETNEYDQETDLYLYNTVYSQENTTIQYIAKPVDALYSISDTFDTRVKYSDKKVDGEVSDSWFKFRTNNFVDLEKTHGSVNNLEVYKDNLLFWQDHAFGTLAVNQRSVLSTEAGTGLVLGTGGLLDHIDYVSREVGNTNKYGIAVTDRSCYWVDNNIKEVYQFTAGTRGAYNLQSKNDPLSTAKGMSSYLKSQASIVNVVSGVDKENNEVLFTITPGERAILNLETGDPRFVFDVTNYAVGDFIYTQGKYFQVADRDGVADTWIELATADAAYIDTGDYTAGNTIAYVGQETNPGGTIAKRTFSFNEIINSFGSFYSFTPGFYFPFKDKFFTTQSRGAAHNDLYVHGGGNYCQFYGGYNDSSITITFNPDYAYTKVFDNLVWYNEVIGQDAVTGGDVNRFNDSFTTIQVYNDYQNTDELDLAYKTQSGATDVVYDRRERGFTLALPRNAVDKDVSDNEDMFDSNNIDQTQLFKDRIRDKYSILKLTYANTSSNYRFVCPYVSALYRLSAR